MEIQQWFKVSTVCSRGFHAIFSNSVSDHFKSITLTVEMLLEYYTWSALREMACQVASLASLQEKQKQETAVQCVNLKKQWRYLETGLRRWSETVQQTRCLWTGRTVSERDKQTWSTLRDSVSSVRIPGLWSVCGVSKYSSIPHYSCVCFWVCLFKMCNCKTEDVVCVFTAGRLRVFCRGLRGAPQVHWYPAVPHTRHPG